MAVYDLLLAEKVAYPGFEGEPTASDATQIVSLTMPLEKIVVVDAVIVT